MQGDRRTLSKVKHDPGVIVGPILFSLTPSESDWFKLLIVASTCGIRCLLGFAKILGYFCPSGRLES